MRENFMYVGSSYLVLKREGTVLLQRRKNTGYMDGHYGLPSGHLEGGETAREGGSREFKEEIGVEIAPMDLVMVHVMHRKGSKDSDERIDFFMTTEHFEGEVRNMEPEKCDDLSWFPLIDLPPNTIPYIRQALEEIRVGSPYSEFGWHSPS